jgi:hypothetical protein
MTRLALVMSFCGVQVSTDVNDTIEQSFNEPKKK